MHKLQGLHLILASIWSRRTRHLRL